MGEGACKSPSHHQGAPKDSTCLHNRLRGTAKSRRELPWREKTSYLDPPWAMEEKLLMICAKSPQSLKIEGSFHSSGKPHFINGVYWDLERWRNLFKHALVDLAELGQYWDQNWSLQILPSELLRLPCAISPQWKCCKRSSHTAFDLFPLFLATLWWMESHLLPWPFRF